MYELLPKRQEPLQGRVLPAHNQLNEKRSDHQGDHRHQLDQDVQARSGSILEGIADGIADHGRFVGLGAFATVVARFDIFFGVVPRTTGVGLENRHHDTGGSHTRQQAAKGGDVVETDDHRHGHRQGTRHDHFPKGRGGGNVHALGVLSFSLAFEQPRDFPELAPDFLDHLTGCAADGLHGHGREEEGQHRADE